MAEVLTIAEISERFHGIDPRWLKQQAKAGKLPHLKVGRRMLFNPVAVAEVLARMAAEFPPMPIKAAARG